MFRSGVLTPEMARELNRMREALAHRDRSLPLSGSPIFSMAMADGTRVDLVDSDAIAGGVVKLGKLDGVLSYQGSATVSVWSGTPGSEADSTENVTAYDWLLSSGQTVASGTQVVVANNGDGWYVIGAQCP